MMRFCHADGTTFTTSAGTAGSGGCASSNAAAGGGAIDAHSHIWTREVVQFPLFAGVSLGDLDPGSFTAEDLLAESQAAGVERVVLIGHDVFHGYDNSYMLNAASRFPTRFRVCALIDDRGPDPAGLMRQLLLQGVTGFRINPWEKGLAMLGGDTARRTDWLTTKGMEAMWTAAASTGQAMCCLIDPSDLPAIDTMCAKFPNTTVVVDHFARIGVSGSVDAAQLGQLCALARHPNVYVKCSAFYALGLKQPPYLDLLPMIQKLHAAFTARRLMWASDCPYQLTGAAAGLQGPIEVVQHAYADSIAVLQKHADWLTDEERERMLRGTAQEVFFFV
jgi:predicted TIM-barrel fold metal-dependent hydrolase